MTLFLTSYVRYLVIQMDGSKSLSNLFWQGRKPSIPSRLKLCCWYKYHYRPFECPEATNGWVSWRIKPVCHSIEVVVVFSAVFVLFNALLGLPSFSECFLSIYIYYWEWFWIDCDILFLNSNQEIILLVIIKQSYSKQTNMQRKHVKEQLQPL